MTAADELPASRVVFALNPYSRSQVMAMLRGLLVSELVSPSEGLWIVSPWVSDIYLVDNRIGRFDGLRADWGTRKVRFSEVLDCLVSRGGRVHLVLRPAPENAQFRERVVEIAERSRLRGGRGSLNLRISEDLHIKGVLSQRRLFLDGSMNITFRGIHMNQEKVGLTSDPLELGEALQNMHAYFADE